MPRLKVKAFETLGEMLRPPPPPRAATNETWAPRLHPTQQKLFDSPRRYILGWSEKGSGKTHSALHKLLRHCYENQNALALIIVPVRSMATKGGAWDKLQNEVLPEWEQGLGLDHSAVFKDSQHNECMWVANQFGGWSMVVLISAPHAKLLRARIRGYEPSFVFADELTSADSPIYFESVVAQMGRRVGVTGPQQYVGACNPDGQAHWVYQKWWVESFNELTCQYDPDFENIYFPKEENAGDITPGYFDQVAKIYKNNPVEYARMVKGIWLDQPTGEALFAELYNPVIHVRPLNEHAQPDPRRSLLPDKDYPIILGLDPGAVYNAFIFEQWLPIEDDGKIDYRWLIFDEIYACKKRIPYDVLIPIVMARIAWWNRTVNAKMPSVWISDNSAFNVYRAATGSYDVLEIEKIYENRREQFGLDAMRVRAAPKPAGSVISCVRTMQQLLAERKIIISARCQWVQRMLTQLHGKKQEAGGPIDPEAAMTPQRSDYLHPWDALRYPILTAGIQPTLLLPSTSTQELLGKN